MQACMDLQQRPDQPNQRTTALTSCRSPGRRRRCTAASLFGLCICYLAVMFLRPSADEIRSGSSLQ